MRVCNVSSTGIRSQRKLGRGCVAPNAYVALFLYRVPKSLGVEGDYRHFQPSEQHSAGCISLARYDFLLVFYSDLSSRWNRCRVTSGCSAIPFSYSAFTCYGNSRHDASQTGCRSIERTPIFTYPQTRHSYIKMRFSNTSKSSRLRKNSTVTRRSLLTD